jgi:hypothetical protein
MTPIQGLSADERKLLLEALQGPIVDRDPIALGLCLKLCGLKLLQRAGSVAAANGWQGSPHAFCLTREGWCVLKAERRNPPISRAV